VLDKQIVESISTDQFKIFLLEQIKRSIKKGYKTHLNKLESLHQDQLKIIYENQSVFDNDALKKLILLDDKKFSEYRKSILDVGNNITRDIENLFDNLVININNKKSNVILWAIGGEGGAPGDPAECSTLFDQNSLKNNIRPNLQSLLGKSGKNGRNGEIRIESNDN
jgi:hypothetical protein